MATAVHPIPAARAPYERPSGSWARLATSVLDLLREAVFVLGRDARLLGLNRAARALLRGQTVGDLKGELLRLALLTAVLLPAGLYFSRIAIRRAKREGSLVQY